MIASDHLQFMLTKDYLVLTTYMLVPNIFIWRAFHYPQGKVNQINGRWQNVSLDKKFKINKKQFFNEDFVSLDLITGEGRLMPVLVLQQIILKPNQETREPSTNRRSFDKCISWNCSLILVAMVECFIHKLVCAMNCVVHIIFGFSANLFILL